VHDTSPDVTARLARMMALKTPEERLLMASSMFDAAKILMEAGIRHENESVSEAQLRAKLFIRMYGGDFSKSEIEKIMKRMPNMQPDEGR
jgi:hypothetical protein